MSTFFTTVKILVLVNLTGICFTGFSHDRLYHNPEPFRLKPANLIVPNTDFSLHEPVSAKANEQALTNRKNPGFIHFDPEETYFLKPAHVNPGNDNRVSLPLRSIL